MTKKDILKMESTAYYSGFNGLEIKDIEYGIDDYLLCVSGSWGGKKTAHRLKIYYTLKGDAYIKLYGYKVPLGECIRI